uniref:AGL24 n=1 Tax=Monotropa hypopitys TaxID=176248 RepID=A0A1Q1N9Y2_9ERIC|nr:AGL24 [Monotropa hypopitys]
MARERIKIQKIDNVTARQVTFSKRRKGLFKKAEELAVLCDVDVALIMFSATGKLFQFASSSMNDVLAKYTLHSSNIEMLDQPSLELQLENSNSVKLMEEISERTNELRRMRGEEIQGLKIEDLQQLEKMLQEGLGRVIEAKSERVMNEIANLQKKGDQLIEENQRLKKKMVMINSKGKQPVADVGIDLENFNFGEEGQSSESVTNVCSSNSSAPPPEDDCSDTSLKLGLPF